MRTMIAQDTDRTGDSLKERRIGIYGRLKRIPCAVRRHRGGSPAQRQSRRTRACAIHEKSGLVLGAPQFMGFVRRTRMVWAATHPIARLGGRLTLSLLVAGVQPAPRRFAPVGLPNAHSGASNCGF